TYDVSLFSAQAIERLNDHLCRLLTALSAVNEQEVALHTLPILSEAEQHHLVHGLNNTKMDYPKDSCIHELFEQQAQATPDKVAVEFGSQQLTYGALNRKANQLAHYLVNTQGVTPDTLVGLCVERSLEMIVGMLGILKAGGAYVPLDPNYPQARLAHIISDSRVQVVLTQSHLKAVVTQVSTVMLDDLEHAQSTHIFSGYSTEDLQHCADTLNGNNLAYVIYTSGSTGQPKGVMLTHQNVVNYLTQVQRYPHDDVECTVMSTSLSFDATVTPIFGAWVRGISLKVLPENNNILTALSESIVTEKSAMFKLTPAHLQGLELSQQAQGKHVVIVGGEAFSYELARKAINMMPNSLFINEYGPTEATVGCSAEIFGQQALKDMEGAVDINIGRAIVNTQLLVLDDKQNLLPMGATGELYIGGEGLARGYLHQPALTAERFIYNPFYDATQANSSEHLYRTGDLVRYLDDGKLEFVGRTDEQVKLRGYRIELAEIEHHLSMLAEVDSACVLVTDVAGMPQLVAYIKGLNNQALSTAQLQEALRSNLPDYMVPEIYVPLEQWPLTPNGKIDKRALIELGKTQSKTVRRLAQTPSEQKLAAIWAELLDLSQEEVCTQTSFFELGGNSLLTMRMMARIKGAFNQMMNVEQLFEEPTIQSIANKLDCLAILQTTAEDHNDEDVIAEGTL
ncbi:non-ribosomal peptide synthetase, partial [Pseudoalteromonas amylolytica]|uniref:non-ribosomal peptide synthetase n=2 Tax=Pseudoalteromonas TaxID=53246 RepID=UPI001113714F